MKNKTAKASNEAVAPDKSFGLDGSILKLIAMIVMLIDHVAAHLMTIGTVEYAYMRIVGRIAFPIFALLIAEGFIHTRSRLKYFSLLLLFALISEIPWQLLYPTEGTHNVMFTLTLGVVTLQMMEYLVNHNSRFFALLAVLGSAILSQLWLLDYEWYGILMIVAFYFSEKRTDKSVDNKIQRVVTAIPLMLKNGLFGTVITAPFIYLYNGKRGFITGKTAKYMFYAFYPAHLMIIWLIGWYLGN